MSTDTLQFLADLEAGIFASKIGVAITNAARGAICFDQAGTVTVSFKFEQIGNSRQVNITHKLVVVEPTERGKLTEETTTETPMYVGMSGDVTAFPPTVPTRQIDLYTTPTVGESSRGDNQ